MIRSLCSCRIWAYFVTVAAERSFSVAAKKLHRTQPAVSQAIRRLEEELGDRLFDRSSRNGTLTEAGRLLQDYAERLLPLAADAELAVRELQQVRRGRVIIGANEAAVHSLLPLIDASRAAHPQVLVDVRRVPPAPIARGAPQPQPRLRRADVPAGRRGLQSLALGGDELVMLAHPAHPLAARRRVTIEEVGSETVIAHNDPSPARERVLRALRAAAHAHQHSGRAAEPRRHQARGRDGHGVALLPRRCALTEIASGQLVAIKVPELSTPAPGPARVPARRTVARRGAFLDRARDGRTCGEQLAPAEAPNVSSALERWNATGVRSSRRAIAPRLPRPLRSDPAAVPSRPNCRRGMRLAHRRQLILNVLPPAVDCKRREINGHFDADRLDQRDEGVDVGGTAVDARHARARPSCRRRSPRTTRRRPRGCPSGEWPAARARATIRNRSSR